MADTKTAAEGKTVGETKTADNRELEKLRTELAAARAEAEQAQEARSRAEAERDAAAREVRIMQEKAEQQAAKEEEQARQQLRQQEKVLLTINSEAGDSTPVMVSVNGYASRIARDVPVLVPSAVAEALKLAVMDVPQVKREPNGQQTTMFRHVNRFSFTVGPAPVQARTTEAV